MLADFSDQHRKSYRYCPSCMGRKLIDSFDLVLAKSTLGRLQKCDDLGVEILYALIGSFQLGLNINQLRMDEQIRHGTMVS